jgi:hypothetical protein
MLINVSLSKKISTMEEGRLLMTMKMKIKATLNQNATRMLQEEEQSDLEGKNGCIIYTYELIWRQSDLEGGKRCIILMNQNAAPMIDPGRRTIRFRNRGAEK